MRTLSKTEVQTVAGAGLNVKLPNLVQVLVDVVAKKNGSTKVDVTAPLTSVLVNVVWGK